MGVEGNSTARKPSEIGLGHFDWVLARVRCEGNQTSVDVPKIDIGNDGRDLKSDKAIRRKELSHH